MQIFQKTVIKKYIQNLDKQDLDNAYNIFRSNYSLAKIEKIKQLKEEEYQDGFLRELFVDVFESTRTHSNLRFKKIYIIDLPVGNVEKINHEKANNLADKMLSLNKDLQIEKVSFSKTLQEERNIEKLSRKLQNFQNLEYEEFKKELRKKKVKISLGTENNEWREYFNTSKQNVNELQTQINNTDKEIDKMVYELYELTDEEITIIENDIN